jgi:hypothetical protein
MSFKRLDPEDIVISADSITSTLWSNDSPSLSTFFTSSLQVNSSGDYYLNVFNSNNTSSIQFALTYGNKNGSGSAPYNVLAVGKTPTSTIYGQYQNLVIGDEDTLFNFGGYETDEIFVISIDRSRYKEKLFLGSLSLSVSGSLLSFPITLTDNSRISNSIQFNNAGRVFQLVSGSQGKVFTGSNAQGYHPSNSGSYGWVLPDIGTIILNPKAMPFLYSGSFNGNPNIKPHTSLFRAISGSNQVFRLNSEETISSAYYFIRARNAEFNYTTNPNFIKSDGEIIYDSLINDPQTFITTIGLYNDNNELLAVAKLSKPLTKNFVKESLLRCKLDY